MTDVPESDRILASTLAKTIARRRKELGLTQEEVALQAGLDRRTYQDLEYARSDHKSNKPANPRLTTLIRLTRVLGCDVQDLIGDAEVAYNEAEETFGPTEYRKYN
ncbi:transcriptional regulator with XRE-family HTH domain [Arcanobacterium wilhelmae]|uniref:Transcriptional regulator with XRE-family HTH domain n=1 Tax=Arcanobacterium wilhelmae TaxID=1803177 RepID=A0ABT9N8C2_9ACTO|nr:helix-turn-helix transcriptional regulator [Arcanobacterium wilhelmae]MDP9799955.1 transcriptional regulator with XRE-family HTH domain [Arcanobacterium wilhelmae]WFN91089.1 helix-turn-helix transcriptional regulator [Arcanobacterium wilhelmae]